MEKVYEVMGKVPNSFKKIITNDTISKEKVYLCNISINGERQAAWCYLIDEVTLRVKIAVDKVVEILNEFESCIIWQETNVKPNF